MTLLSLQVNNNGNDDCGSTSFGLLSATVLITGFFISGSNFRGFMRFTNVTIDPSSTISAADHQVNAVDTDASTTYNCNVHLNAADNPSSPASGSALEGLSLTSASTAVTTNLSTTAGTWYTISITSAVQEIVNRGGWANGNAMLVLWINNSSSTNRRWGEYSNSPTVAGKLDITYTAPSGGILIGAFWGYQRAYTRM